MHKLTVLLALLLMLACDRGPVAPDTNDGSTAAMTFSESNAGGSALAFDGVDDYVRVPDAPSLDMTDGLTIAAWIYIDAYTEWASFVTKGGRPDQDPYPTLWPNNYTIHQSGPAFESEFGHLRFSPSLPDPLLPESDTQIPLHEWHHVAMTYDGATLRFYYDGEPDGSASLTGPLVPNNDPLHIGVDFPGGDEYWHGKIDEVRIWNVPLRAVEIRAAMNGHASPRAAALVGYWQFDEGAGATARDRSRANNDGELVNVPTWVTPGAPLGNAGK